MAQCTVLQTDVNIYNTNTSFYFNPTDLIYSNQCKLGLDIAVPYNFVYFLLADLETSYVNWKFYTSSSEVTVVYTITNVIFYVSI